MADATGPAVGAGIPDGFDPETWQALSEALGPPPPGAVDSLTEIVMMIRLPHPDLTVPMEILVQVPLHILTTRLETPTKQAGIIQFQRNLGTAVNQIMNDWVDRYQLMKSAIASGTYRPASETQHGGDFDDPLLGDGSGQSDA